MIGIAHGYGLGGSGSNLWTRETVSALCDNGETVHLMCQESHPEQYDFVTELHVHPADGDPERVFRRNGHRPGRCIVHRPDLEILPTYVRPGRQSAYVRSILDLDAGEIEAYLERNVRTLRRIARDHDVRAWHVNHAILLSEALRRLGPEGIRFAVMPHGSALEYVVRHDEAMRDLARTALRAADRVFALNDEVRDRLARYFPDLDLAPRTVTVPVGVDTGRFRPVPRDQRAPAIERLAEALADTPRGRAPQHYRVLHQAIDDLPDAATAEDFLRAVAPALDYAASRPDADLEDRLRDLDWESARVVTFVGRLLPAKGVPALVAAFPSILRAAPDARLLIVGAGWLREYLEAFLHALAAGRDTLALAILEWAAERQTEGARPSGIAFLHGLRRTAAWDEYVAAARDHLRPDRVLFTGFLEHEFLAHVFPLSDVAVFPSAVAEASPLVVPEAAACGCLPMGTDFAGMRRALDGLAPHLPHQLRPLIRLDPDPARTAHDIVDHVIAALRSRTDPGPALRDAAVREFDWHRVARTLADELHALAATP